MADHSVQEVLRLLKDSQGFCSSYIFPSVDPEATLLNCAALAQQLLLSWYFFDRYVVEKPSRPFIWLYFAVENKLVYPSADLAPKSSQGMQIKFMDNTSNTVWLINFIQAKTSGNGFNANIIISVQIQA